MNCDTTLGTPTPQCLQVMALLEDRQDGVNLSTESLSALESHLADCARCRAHQVFLDELAEDIRALPEFEPADALSDKIMARIEALPGEKNSRQPAAMAGRRRQWQWAAAAVLVIVSMASLAQWSGKPSGPVVAQGGPKPIQGTLPPRVQKQPPTQSITVPVKVQLAQLPKEGSSGTSVAPVMPVAASGGRVKIAQQMTPHQETPSHVQAPPERSPAGGELIADASIGGDDILFSLATPQGTSDAATGKPSGQDTWSIDQEQQMSASGEVTLVDFVGF